MQTKKRLCRNSNRCVVVGRLPLVEMILIRAVLGRNVRQILETYAVMEAIFFWGLFRPSRIVPHRPHVPHRPQKYCGSDAWGA